MRQYTGTIKLIHNDTTIRILSFRGKADRKKIITKWEKLYGDRFKQCEFGIELFETRLSIKKQKFWGRYIDRVAA